MIDPSARLLSSDRLERLASAFELSHAEVLADTPLIMNWCGSSAELLQSLNARHAWDSEESFYFVRWVRLNVQSSSQPLLA